MLKFMKMIITVSCIFVCAYANAGDNAYESINSTVSGVGNVVFTQGGEYVHGKKQSDRRVATPPFLLSKGTRHEYEYFSSYEVAALEKLYASEVEKLRKSSAPKIHLDWPKVVIRNGEVCVPELPFSNTAEWQSHLICWQEKSNG